MVNRLTVAATLTVECPTGRSATAVLVHMCVLLQEIVLVEQKVCNPLKMPRSRHLFSPTILLQQRNSESSQRTRTSNTKMPSQVSRIDSTKRPCKGAQLVLCSAPIERLDTASVTSEGCMSLESVHWGLKSALLCV